MRAFALVPAWLVILPATCVGGEHRYSPAPDLPGIVQFSHSWAPAAAAPGALSEPLRLFQRTVCVRQPLWPELSDLFLFRLVVRLLPCRTWILQRWRVPALQPEFLSV